MKFNYKAGRWKHVRAPEEGRKAARKEISPELKLSLFLERKPDDSRVFDPEGAQRCSSLHHVKWEEMVVPLSKCRVHFLHHRGKSTHAHTHF